MLESPGAGLRPYNGTVWGTIQAVDDSRTMQRVDVRGVNGEMVLGVERPQTYGHTSVPLPPEQGTPRAAEVVVGFKNGDRAHPFVQATDDRRYYPKNLKAGESKSYDHQGQNLHIANDGMKHTAKSHVMSATEGDKPLTTFELNDQHQGIDARLSQAERAIHGLFDVTSRMRQMVQSLVPSLQQLAPILSQTPDGLDKMEQAIAGGPAAAYLQKQISQALPKFGASPIAAVSSVLGGGIEALIQAAEAQLASLIAANPVVGLVDGLQDELANLRASASPAVVAEMQPILQGLIASTTAGNPVVGQAADLRSQLATLISTAGPGLGFLAPQQRMAQGLTKSLRLSQ